MKKFEYRLEHIEIDIKTALGQDSSNGLMDTLNEIGKDGWRLCGVDGYLYYFSREISG